VPTYPPHPSRKESLASFVGIATSAGAKVALTNGEFAALKRVNEMKEAFLSRFKKSEQDMWPEQLAWVVTDNETLRSPPKYNTRPLPSLDSIAFLQFTSGSTSQPKGVSISHANLAHNLSIIVNELQASPSTVVVAWLPQYHDMGLIGSLLGILYCGGSGYYMSPIAFLARPMAWMEAVSEYRGTHLQAPNFAFGLTARMFDGDQYCFGEEDRRRRLDLTCLKHIINGAEPVTESSIGA
jgi:acyl-CoA synthetase (AMP-forming)/AMP-acid ligase II